jgi:hypothetical protein
VVGDGEEKGLRVSDMMRIDNGRKKKVLDGRVVYRSC